MSNARNTPLPQPEFLPMTRQEMEALGWAEIDVLLVSGDAYIDHPACGPALVGRWLVNHGFRVGIVAQPDWRGPESVTGLGRPRLFAGVSAGALDSMLAHYTAFRKKRSDDAYTPGGRAGARPNRATIVYANLVRQAFPGLPLVLGGIEASMRRAVHYDFWANAIRRPILFDAKADLVVWGMGERAVLETARRLDADPKASLKGMAGTVFAGDAADLPEGARSESWPSLEEIVGHPPKLVDAALAMERHALDENLWALQQAGGRAAVFAPPAAPLTTAELDHLYDLGYSRKSHPSYCEPIPAQAMLADSICTHRGCGGGCAFCALALHQGRKVGSRSRESILAEAARLARDPAFRGSISDVGGPSAGMWRAVCAKDGPCRRTSCLTPRLCPHFKVDQGAFIDLLRSLRAMPGIRHVRVASGIRHDLAMEDPAALSALLAEFVGGQLKVAPEHVSETVLKCMRKPTVDRFEAFMDFFARASRGAGKQQYLVPYLMSAYPGATDQDMELLAGWLKQRGWKPQQVQCFIPTPGTLATAMYYSETDERGRPLFVARTDAQRLRQHHMLQTSPSGTKKNGHRENSKKRVR